MPLVLNSVQEELHADLENQLAETGMIRAIVLKARQMGVSTYTGARFYHRMRHSEGYRSLIMAHREDASKNLAQMVHRYHDLDADQPRAQFKSVDQLVIENDSGITISTAGAQATGAGRSFTFQLAHLSELGFWQNAADHMNAVLRAVPDVPGSEVIIESTANGASGPFYTIWQAAMQGVGRFKPLFYPWFMHTTYQLAPPSGWHPGEAVRELAERFDLSAAQLYWAETKNAEIAALDGEPVDTLAWRFVQEYPSTPEEAFRAGRTGGYIAPSVVAAARRRRNVFQPDMPLVFGCDFATGGGGSDAEYIGAEQERERGLEGGEEGDANFFIDRQGRSAGHRFADRFRDRNTISVANRLQARIDEHNPDRVFMDKGGGGASVYDILCQRGYARVLELVDFGRSARPIDQRRFRNKRAEMWGLMRDWLQDGDIPDDDLLESEITGPWVKQEDEMGMLLASKREIRQKLHLSPDGGDALATTFAAPVRKMGHGVGFSAGNLRGRR